MSSITYEETLREAMVDLTEMLEQDNKHVGHKIIGSKQAIYTFFLHYWSAMYLRYVQIFRKLERCYDQILQPQKRQDVRVVLDSCMGRMLEMKHKIVEYCGEYVNLDEVLVDLKLTPDSLEIPIPRYFVEDRQMELAERRKYIDSLRNQFNIDGTAPEGAAGTGPGAVDPATGELPMSLEKAVEILQCSERGRQGRQRAKFMKSIFEQEQHQRREYEYGTSMGENEAAGKIQKIIKGYLGRKRTKQLMKEELEFLGMEPSEQIVSNKEKDKLAKTLAERKMKQSGNLAEFNQQYKETRAQIKAKEGGRTMESMLDEIMERLSYIRMTATDDVVPEFPSEEEGGSLALLGRLPNDPAAEEEARRKAEEEAAGAKKPEAKPGGKKDPKAEEEEAAPVIGPSMFWNRFVSGRERYVQTWHQHFQQTYFDKKDFDQKLDSELLRKEIMEGPGGTTQELRRCVDKLVTVEVANLRARIEREKGMKPPKVRPPKPPKPPKWKDPTEGKKMEVHMNNLVWLNVVQQCPNVRLSDYIGTHNMMGPLMEDKSSTEMDDIKKKWETLINNWNDTVEKSLRMGKEQFQDLFAKYCTQGNWLFEPSMLQVRQSVAEYCILPLGSQVVHDLAPHHKCVLLFGHASSGKTMLTQAVCNESGANMFVLSPAVLNKEGINLGKLVQTVFRVARCLSPSVIYLDECEKIFLGGKNKKKAGAGKSIKIKKDLLQQVKELEVTDRVLVLGNSSSPWDAELKEMVNFFKVMIHTVHPDYSSRMLLWHTLIKQKGAGLSHDFEYEILAHMTAKYTSGTIVKMVNDTLTERRIKRLPQRPLESAEFLPALSKATPIFKEEYEALREFVGKLPMQLRKVSEDDFKEAENPDEKKPKGKPGAKGKK